MSPSDLSTDGISFIVPFHNEETTLRTLYEKITKVCKDEAYHYEIIFVDDGSDDRGFEIIRDIAILDPHVRGLRFSRNFGQTAAMNAGIHQSRAPRIVTMDADLQNDPTDVPRLVSKLNEGFDVVSGWRKDRQDAWMKRFPSKIANAFISRMTGVRLSDYGCSLKIYKREFLEQAPLYGEMHRFIPIFAAWYGARVCEIPVTHHARSQGRSHYGTVGRTLRVLLDLLTVKFLHTYIARPMHFFGGMAALMLVCGFLSGITAIIFKLTHFRDFVATPLPLLTVFLILIGLMFLLMGLLAELLIRIYFEQAGRQSYRIQESIGLPVSPS